MLNQEPPNSKSVEAKLITMLIDHPEFIIEASQLVKEESFYFRKYALIYANMLELHDRGFVWDLLTLQQTIRDKGMFEETGGWDTWNDFMIAYNPTEISLYLAIIHEKYTRRRAIESAAKIIKGAFDETKDVTKLINEGSNLLVESIQLPDTKTVTYRESALEVAREISDNLGRYKEVTGVPTGFESYDKRLSGLSGEGDFYVLAARPSMGKTTFAINAAYNSSEYFGYNGLFFSLEMSTKQVTRKILSQEFSISTDDLKKNKVSAMQIDCIFDTLGLENKQAGKLFIDDTPNAQLSYIKAKAHKYKAKHDIKFIYIDYLQLITCEPKGNRTLEVDYISKSLKALASELKVPVIALAQLSRAVEMRGGAKRPQLSDLREGGGIEQDASTVTFLWRPEYYGILEDEDGTSLKGVTALITPKNRHGEVGEDYLFFDGANSLFCDYDYKNDNKVTVDMYDRRLIEWQQYQPNFDNQKSFRNLIDEN